MNVEKQRVAQEKLECQWESEYPRVVVEDDEGEIACTIRAPFHDIPASGLDVIVAPQMSFGTGHHATTHLMTARLLSLPLQGRRVLDMGCGTGVLALVAAKEGAGSILGIDIEHAAVQNAQDNHALNAGKRIGHDFVHGDGSACDDMQDETWDVVCANIHKAVLVADMTRYAGTLKEGGHLLLSGFFEGDVPALEASVHAAGMEVLGVDVRNGWACMHCGKPLG